MKIIKLESENVKRLYAVEIKPDGNLIVIGGKNAQGKSSVLDSIEMALKGTSSVPPRPIHSGKDKARIVIELDEINVTRTFTASGTKLVVSDKKGFIKSSPQALLDSLVGKLSFDPLGFIKMKSDEQLKIVKELAGINFSEFDDEVKRIYDERTGLNREIKSLQAQIQPIQKYEDVPEREILVNDLLKDLGIKAEINQKNQKKRDALSSIETQIVAHAIVMDNLRDEIRRLREKWDHALNYLEELKSQKDDQLVMIDTLQDEDVESIHIQISQAEETNKKVRSNNKRNELMFDCEVRQERSQAIDKRLEEIDTEKLKLISSSKLPIKDLTFDSNTLYYNGIPFPEQASSAEQLRVSTKMGFAMNPKLKILLIRDGSLLDEDNLKIEAEIAEEEGGQVWLERVGEGKECQVIIEDGRVKE